MGGGVNPIEWAFAPVALSHMAYNAAAQQVSPKAKLVAAGSPDDIRNDKAQDQQLQLGEAQADAARRAEELRYNTTPQTAAEAFASRLRAKSAKQSLTSTGGRASEYLTSSLGV